MELNELWDFCVVHSVCTHRPYDRDWLWLAPEVFLSIHTHFVPSRNIFHPGQNYRSRHHHRHIHAIDQGAYVHCHLDTGNISLTPYSIKTIFDHTVHDLAPHLWLSIKTRRPLKDIFAFPNDLTKM